MTINVAGASGDRDLAAIDNTQLSEFTALACWPYSITSDT